jgi:hypothetical protein
MNRHHATREAWHPQTKQDQEAILSELNEVLASPHFRNSKRYPTLLRHIVENTLAGNLERLKERTLGVEVFDRPPTYDTNTDTVVRYTAGEVRKRLLLYYSERDNHSGIRISLPAGSYVAEFGQEHEDVAEDQEYQQGDLHEVEAMHATSLVVHEPEMASFVGSADEIAQSHGSAGTVAGVQRKRMGAIWLVAAAAVVCAVFLALWLRPRSQSAQSTVDEFWAPVLRDQRAMIVCTGSSVFAPQNKSGVETAGKDIDYTFVSMQIASSIAQVSGAIGHSGIATQLASAATTTLPDLREHSVTLLGGYNNQWTMRLTQPLRFYFIEGQAPKEIIADRAQPTVRWERDDTLPYSSADDYALVSRFRDPTIDGWVVVLAGLGRNGTEAAAQFATSAHYLDLLKSQIGGELANRNVEAVLKVSVIDGKTGAPSILAAYSW